MHKGDRSETAGISLDARPEATHTRWIIRPTDRLASQGEVAKQRLLVFGLTALSTASILGEILQVFREDEAWWVLSFLAVICLLFLHQARKTLPISNREEDELLEDFRYPGAKLVTIAIQVDGVLTGSDSGILWPEDGMILFNGLRTSFSLNLTDISFQRVPIPFWERFCALLHSPSDSMLVRVGGHRVRISVGLPATDVRLSGGVSSLQKLVKAYHGESSPLPSQFPPIEVQLFFVDRSLGSLVSLVASLAIPTGTLIVWVVEGLLQIDSASKAAYALACFAPFYILIWAYLLMTSRAGYRLYGSMVRRRAQAKASTGG